MKKNIFLSILVLTVSLANGQKALNIAPNIGTSLGENRNINHSSGSDVQDLKRAVVTILSKQGNQWSYESGFLVNTVQNTIEEGKMKLYIMTAEHAIAQSDTVYVSFNYEMPHATDRGNRDTFTHFANVHKIAINNRILDPSSDLALLEIDIDEMDANPDDYENHNIVFYNAYALGWNLNPVFNKNNLVSVSHPQGDIKKIFKNPTDISIISNFPPSTSDNNLRNYTNKLFFDVEDPLENAGHPEIGSSGSPLICQDTHKAFAVRFSSRDRSGGIGGIMLVRSNGFSSIANSWIPDNGMIGFKSFLDTQDTWISEIPGGYIGELLANSSSVDYDLEVSTEKKEIELMDLNAKNFFEFGLEGISHEATLGDGTLLSGNQVPVGGKTVMLALKASNDDVLYESNYSIVEANNQTTIFRGLSSNQQRGIPYFKSQILENLRNTSYSNFIIGSLTGLKSFKIENAKLSLSTNSGTAKVRAIKLPSMMPFNAVELFDRNRFKDLWRSYKYKPSRGENSNQLHIDSIKVEFRHNINRPFIDTQNLLLNPEEIINLKTGDNGGYLNLVNPNFKIDDIFASEPGSNKNKLIITLYTNSTDGFYYGVWIDYHPDRKNGNNANPNDDYTYNFVYDTTVHLDEKLETGFAINGGEITITHEVPYEDELPLTNGSLATRLRVAVAKQPQQGIPVSQDGIYTQGEVEDYLIIIKESSDEDIRSAMFNHYNAIILLEDAKTDETCDDATVGEGIDQTEPASSLPIFQGGGGVGDGVCEDILDYTHNAMGENAINFDGQMYMNVDQDGQIVHEPSNKKTISIDFLKETISTNQDEILYEEGGNGQSGLSIRLKNGKIDFGVKIENELLTVESSSTITANEMTNVTAAFDEGKLELYVNGVLEKTDTQFSTQNTTIIPEHLDDAGLGGVAGTTIWGISIPNFDGLVDYFAYWNDALTASTIAILGYTTASSNNAKTATTNTNNKPNKTEKEEFSIFPNPATDELNILVEVKHAGPISITIFDLGGRQVYEMKESNITAGHQLITLKNLKIASGEYIIKVQTGNVRRSEKVVFE